MSRISLEVYKKCLDKKNALFSFVAQIHSKKIKIQSPSIGFLVFMLLFVNEKRDVKKFTEKKITYRYLEFLIQLPIV